MVTFLTVLFVILCFFLVIAILIQQGKGDMGLGGLGGGGQMLFGGSGGQDFFEKLTWIMGAIFVIGALGLTILKTKEVTKSRLTNITKTQQTNNNIPAKK
jgi:preprotein translocase subunit SecG